jgi:hypothetical protein
MVQDGATLLYTPWPGQFVAIDIATGEPFGPDIAHGYGGQYKTGEFSADGRILALGYADGGLLLHKSPAAPPRKLLPATIDVDKLKKLWQSLAQPDAKFAYKARLQLKAASQQTLALFRQELKPQKADAKQLADWIEQLGSTSFKQRESALTALEKAGDAAQQALESALARKPVLEEKLRIELLLGKIKPLPSGETLRALRAIVILEAIGSEDARTVLRDLAEGAPGARVTEAAKAALKRM